MITAIASWQISSMVGSNAYDWWEEIWQSVKILASNMVQVCPDQVETSLSWQISDGYAFQKNLPYQFKERANQQTHFEAFGTYLTKDYKIISCNDLKTKVATVIWNCGSTEGGGFSQNQWDLQVRDGALGRMDMLFVVCCSSCIHYWSVWILRNIQQVI